MQSNLTNTSTNNEHFFQNETHLIRWLKTRKDILQALNAIFYYLLFQIRLVKIYFDYLRTYYNNNDFFIIGFYKLYYF